jgi:hypothetical protein
VLPSSGTKVRSRAAARASIDEDLPTPVPPHAIEGTTWRAIKKGVFVDDLDMENSSEKEPSSGNAPLVLQNGIRSGKIRDFGTFGPP